MSNYPPGAFEALIRIEREAEKFEQRLALASEHYAEELRHLARTEQPVTWVDGGGRERQSSSESFITDFIPDDLINQAAREWLKGNDESANKLFYSACEIGFEKGVEFLATLSAERGE